MPYISLGGKINYLLIGSTVLDKIKYIKEWMKE